MARPKTTSPSWVMIRAPFPRWCRTPPVAPQAPPAPPPARARAPRAMTRDHSTRHGGTRRVHKTSLALVRRLALTQLLPIALLMTVLTRFSRRRAREPAGEGRRKHRRTCISCSRVRSRSTHTDFLKTHCARPQSTVLIRLQYDDFSKRAVTRPWTRLCARPRVT